MEKQYRLLSIFVLGIFLIISLASATSLSAPSQVDLNQNFNLVISGTGFYALEIIIPQGLSIISDPSAGIRTGDLYKTVTTGSLTIVLRGIQSGTYTISGQFTDGSGIKDLNSLTIIIKEQEDHSSQTQRGLQSETYIPPPLPPPLSSEGFTPLT